MSLTGTVGVVLTKADAAASECRVASSRFIVSASLSSCRLRVSSSAHFCTSSGVSDGSPLLSPVVWLPPTIVRCGLNSRLVMFTKPSVCRVDLLYVLLTVQKFQLQLNDNLVREVLVLVVTYRENQYHYIPKTWPLP